MNETATATASSRHVRSLLAATPTFASELGSLTRVDADSLPLLRGLSIKHLRLAPGAIREPHWHVNAAELSYCLSGELLVSVLDTGSTFASFTVGAGQMFHIESGSLHHIENIGAEPAELIVAFRDERPEDFSMHAAFGAMSDAVLGNTYGQAAAAFAPIPRTTEPAYIVARDGAPAIPGTAGFGDPRKFDIEAQTHQIEALSEDIHFLIFFDQPMPADVGYRAAASAYSREVLAATLETSQASLPDLPFTPADPLLVGRVNALD